jgi:ADP-L-glycero-D-manno-heptose 6-epimerase
MIIVTGAAGFIGSCLCHYLSSQFSEPLVAVDDFSRPDKSENLNGLQLHARVDRDQLMSWLKLNGANVSFVFHIGARTDTTEFDMAVFEKLNINYSKELWKWCADHQVPMVYASSAATYGLGELGYVDDEGIVDRLKPLNPYGDSKNLFDQWAIRQENTPPFWAGLKFFNVFGPNEYHKGRMASVIFHAFRQIEATGQMKLFRSHRADYSDGGQKRDFVYVKDVLSVCRYMYEKRPANGIYNLGSGIARTFLDLATQTFKAMGKPVQITFIDTPEDIRDKYQYFTEADMGKLIRSGYDLPFHTLEEGVHDYVIHYLMKNQYYRS